MEGLMRATSNFPAFRSSKICAVFLTSLKRRMWRRRCGKGGSSRDNGIALSPTTTQQIKKKMKNDEDLIKMKMKT